MGKVKIKKFDLDKELDTLPSWAAYGGVWKSYKGSTSTPTPDCTAEKPCLRSGWVTLGGDDQKADYEYVSYTVSDGHRVVTQGLDNPFHARLMATAPSLLRFIKDIAEGEALALSVVDEAKTLLKEVREGVHVLGRHDYTEGPYNPDDYESGQWWQRDRQDD